MSDWDYPFQNSYILNEDQWEEWEPNIHGVPDGVKRGIYGEFEVTPASSGLVVNVAGGVAVVRGFYTRRESEKPLALQPPDTTNPRIDLVVLRRSKSGGGFTRMVITGDATASPVAPALVRDNDNWDLPLAEVYVAANAQSLDAGDITDLRVWTSGLDEHLDDTNNPHGVSYDQVGAAAAEHVHTVSDLEQSGAIQNNILRFDGVVWAPDAPEWELVRTVIIETDTPEVDIALNTSPYKRLKICFMGMTDYAGAKYDRLQVKVQDADNTGTTWVTRYDYTTAATSGGGSGVASSVGFYIWVGANGVPGYAEMLLSNIVAVTGFGIGANGGIAVNTGYDSDAPPPIASIVITPGNGASIKSGTTIYIYGSRK